MSVTRAERTHQHRRAHRASGWIAACAGLALAGCSEQAPRPFDELPAADVVENAPDCTPPPPAKGMQRYNILDVYPGLQVAEAKRRLGCALPSATMAALNWVVPAAKGMNMPDTYRFTLELTVDRVESVQFEVDGVGPEARVLRIQRLERFGRASAPSLESIEGSLREKYGAPDLESALPVGRSLSWRFAPQSDQRLPEDLFRRCAPVVGGSVFTAMRAHVDVCGLTVLAEIEPFPGNDLLVESVRVSIWDMGASPGQSDALRRQLEQAVAKAGRSENLAETENQSRTALTPRF